MRRKETKSGERQPQLRLNLDFEDNSRFNFVGNWFSVGNTVASSDLKWVTIALQYILTAITKRVLLSLNYLVIQVEMFVIKLNFITVEVENLSRKNMLTLSSLLTLSSGLTIRLVIVDNVNLCPPLVVSGSRINDFRLAVRPSVFYISPQTLI